MTAAPDTPPPAGPPPRITGLAAIRHLAGFITDPVAGLRGVYERHGPLVLLDDLVPFRKIDKPSYVAVGQPYNSEVLGNTRVWRTGRWSARGPRESAQYRLGWGLTSINGRAHAHYRPLLSRPLRRASVDSLGEDIGRLVEEHVARWPVGQPIDLWEHVKTLMRTVAITLLFGDDRERGLPLARMIDEYMEIHARPAVAGCPVDLPGMPFRKLLRHADALERCALDFAAPKRGKPDERDLLAIVVNSPDPRGNPPGDGLIAGHIPILFGAAYETCQTALIWALFLIAQHRAVACDLVDEIDGALGGAPATLARVGELPLLDAVFKESMRILPTVPHQIRVSLTDTTLGGVPVAARTRVFISAYLTNRLPGLYPEPDRFRPERWSAIDPGPYEYLAFSAGPRLCPGYWFGMGVVKTAIAAALSRFRITVQPGARIDRRVAVAMAHATACRCSSTRATRAGLPPRCAARSTTWSGFPRRRDRRGLISPPAAGRPHVAQNDPRPPPKAAPRPLRLEA